jgi:hypothetical protein
MRDAGVPAGNAWRNDQRLRWPCAALLIFLFCDPRATPDGRLPLGAAFLRAARFNFFRSALSLMFFVFISSFSVQRIFPPASSDRNEGS